MKQSFLMRRIVSTEYFLLASLIVILFVNYAGFDWWWLFLLFPLFDLSAFGYLQGPRAGAFTYNVGHSVIGPSIAIALYIFGGHIALLSIGLAWLFHICVDRAVGYGLKHTEGFGHTHLGKVGKAKRK